MIHTRTFIPADLPAMFAARRSAIRDIAARDYTPAQIAAWARDTDDHASQLERFQTSHTWVAETNGRVIGFTNLLADGYLDCMFVHGAHQGIGAASALLDALETGARREGIKRLYSNVSITARPFFERRGFKVLSDQRVIHDGVEYLNFRMEKDLS